MSTPTDLEARLAAALEARAEAVTPEDLSPSVPPLPPATTGGATTGGAPEVLDNATRPGGPVPDHPRWRRRIAYGAAAAAVLAAVLVPLALTRDDGTPQPAPQPAPADPSPTSSSPSGDGSGTGWPVSSRLGVDLDGDGESDTVRLRVDPVASKDREARVAADLSSDPEANLPLVLTGRFDRAGLAPAGDLDGDGDEELLVERRSRLAWLATPVDLVEGELRSIATSPTRTLLTRGLLEGRVYGYAVSDDGTLTSWVSVDVYDHDGPDQAPPQRFDVEVYTWSLVDEGGERRLVPHPVGQQCVDGVSSAPGGCVVRTPVPTALGPEVSRQLDPGEPLTLETDDGEVTVTVLGPQAPGSRHSMAFEAGDAGATFELLGEGEPVLLDGTFETRAGPAAVAVQASGGTEEWTVATAPDGDELGVLEPVGRVPFGQGAGEVDGEAAAWSTWLSRDGALYTRVFDPHAPRRPAPVYRWTADPSRDALRSERIGDY